MYITCNKNIVNENRKKTQKKHIFYFGRLKCENGSKKEMAKNGKNISRK